MCSKQEVGRNDGSTSHATGPRTLGLNPASCPVFRKAAKVIRQNGMSFCRKILLCCFCCLSAQAAALTRRPASPASSSSRGLFFLAS